MNVNLTSGKECLDAKHINNHTALGAALDVTLNDFLIVESSIDTLPALAETCFLVRKYQLTFLVFLVFHINLNLVANLEVGIVTELACCDDTITLVTDVDNHFFLVNRDYFSLNHLTLVHLVQGFVVGLVEFFFAHICVAAILIAFPIEVCQWLNVFC